MDMIDVFAVRIDASGFWHVPEARGRQGALSVLAGHIVVLKSAFLTTRGIILFKVSSLRALLNCILVRFVFFLTGKVFL